MRKTRILVLIALAATLAVGCEPGAEMVEFGSVNELVSEEGGDAGSEDVDTMIGCDSGTGMEDLGSANGLVSEEGGDAGIEDVDTMTEEGDVRLDEEANVEDLPPLFVKWTDGAENGAKAKFSFSVTNTTQEEITFTPAVFADSPIGSAERVLDETTLAPGAAALFKVNAAALPVLSKSVFSIVSVKLTRAMWESSGEREVSLLSASRYVRHEPGFAKARAYTKKQFQDEFRGVLMSSEFSPNSFSAGDVAIALADETVGDVLGSDGKHHTKTRGASDLALRNEAGNVVAIVTEVRHGEAAGEEMEVEDE